MRFRRLSLQEQLAILDICESPELESSKFIRKRAGLPAEKFYIQIFQNIDKLLQQRVGDRIPVSGSSPQTNTILSPTANIFKPSATSTTTLKLKPTVEPLRTMNKGPRMKAAIEVAEIGITKNKEKTLQPFCIQRCMFVWMNWC